MFTNNNFNGEICGERLWDFVRGLDYENKGLQHRLNLVKDKLHTYEIDGVEFYKGFWDDFFEQTLDSQLSKDGVFYIEEKDKFVDYNSFMSWCKSSGTDPIEYLYITNPFDEHDGFGEWKYSNVNTSNIKLVLNKVDSLYTESNVAKCLEILGTYLLSSDECNKRTEDNIKVYDSYELFRRAIQEQDLIRRVTNANGAKQMISRNTNGDLDGETIHIFKNDKNYMLEKDIKVEDGDYKLFPEIKPYHDLLKDYNRKHKYLRMKKSEVGLTDVENSILTYVKNGRKAIKNDMLDIKIYSMKRFVKFKSPCNSPGESMFKDIIIPNKKEILNMLKILTDKHVIDEDSICCKIDLDNAIDRCKFTKKQSEILELWVMDMKVTEIANYLDVDTKQVDSMLNSICNKIIKIYREQYEDWIGFNFVKSEWKKCSKCGEYKLLKRFRKWGKRGLYQYCRDCE